MAKGELEDKNTNFLKVQTILMELTNALDPCIGEKLYFELRGLYFFVYRRFSEANMQNSPELLDEGYNILLHIRETWQMAVKRYRDSLAEEIEDEEKSPSQGISVKG